MSSSIRQSDPQLPLPKLSKATAWKWPRFIPLNDSSLNKSSKSLSQSSSNAEVGIAKVEAQGFVIRSPSADQAFSSRSSLLSENQPTSKNAALLPMGKDDSMPQGAGPEQYECNPTTNIVPATPETSILPAIVTAKDGGSVTPSDIPEVVTEPQPVNGSLPLASALEEVPVDSALEPVIGAKETSEIDEPAKEGFAMSQKPNRSQDLSGVPMISIQKPSRETSETGQGCENSIPPKAKHKQELTEAAIQSASDSLVRPEEDKNNKLTTISPKPFQPSPEDTESPIAAKASSGGRLLPKIRNVLVRKTYLKVTLGRQLASPIKEALRHQAQGFDATIAEIKVVE